MSLYCQHPMRLVSLFLLVCFQAINFRKPSFSTSFPYLFYHIASGALPLNPHFLPIFSRRSQPQANTSLHSITDQKDQLPIIDFSHLNTLFPRTKFLDASRGIPQSLSLHRIDSQHDHLANRSPAARNPATETDSDGIDQRHEGLKKNSGG